MKIKRKHNINIRLSDVELERLKMCCRCLDCSYSDLIRRELLNVESSIIRQIELGILEDRKEV